MDFSTIKARQDGGYYRDPKEWWADIMLVFSNAKRYNAPGSDCYLMAQTLQVRLSAGSVARCRAFDRDACLRGGGVWEAERRDTRKWDNRGLERRRWLYGTGLPVWS